MADPLKVKAVVPRAIAASELNSNSNSLNPNSNSSGYNFNPNNPIYFAFAAGSVAGYVTGVLHMNHKIGGMRKEIDQLRLDVRRLAAKISLIFNNKNYKTNIVFVQIL